MFALTDHRAPLTAIRGDATVSPSSVNITNLRGNFLGGTVIGTAKVTPVPPMHYEAAATFYNVNLELAQQQLGFGSNTQRPGLCISRPMHRVSEKRAADAGAIAGRRRGI